MAIGMHDGIGILGVCLVLFAYLLLQLETVKFDDLRYLLLNIFGSGMIILSLTRNFNIASFLIESCWVLISVYGLAKLAHRNRDAILNRLKRRS